VIDLLPDRDQVRAQFQDVYDTYRTDGPDQAMPKFMAHAGLGEAPGQAPGAPAWEPTPEQVATMRADAEVFLAHLLRPTTNYRPDIDALRASAPRIALALADRLDTPATEFPGDHAGFISQLSQFAEVLYRLLTDPA
jgi:hypothetical protein